MNDSTVLAVTHDPDWIAQRQHLWRERELSIAEGLTKKQLEDIRVFFFTGIPRKNSWIPPARMLDDFPVFSKEGIAWCLKNYGVSEVNNPSIPSDFSTVQRLFLKRLIYVPGVSRQGKVSLFKYVFGELYEPLRDFPFLIGGEDTFRKVEFHG